jgi:hypothetical protein
MNRSIFAVVVGPFFACIVACSGSPDATGEENEGRLEDQTADVADAGDAAVAPSTDDDLETNGGPAASQEVLPVAKPRPGTIISARP